MNKESIELYTELHRLGRQLHRVSHREWSDRGHHRGQYRLLELIAGRDGIIQRDLAEEMDVRPSSMTEMLARMEAHGLIRREADERDQRAVHVYLTDAGRAMAEEAAGATEDLVCRMLQGFTDEEVSAMLGHTRKLGANLDAMVPPYGPCGGHGEHDGHGEHRGHGPHGDFRHHGCGDERGFRCHGHGSHRFD